MQDFARLLEQLALTPSRNRKIDLLQDYFKKTPDPDRGIALSVLTGNLSFQWLKASKIKEIVMEQVDPHLFKLSYDYVGDLAETVALLWPDKPYEDALCAPLPSLSALVETLNETKKKDMAEIVAQYLNASDANERWALIKLATGGLRIGVSARLAKTALAKMATSDITLQEIEEIWHGLKTPYADLFAWLEGDADKPEIKQTETFHPLMLSNPIDEEKDFERLNPQDFTAEWKWDGIRVQLALGAEARALYSRTGDDISAAFPDILDGAKGQAVLDGELLVFDPDITAHHEPMPFNALQQRLNRKRVDPKLMQKNPAFIRVYDILFKGEEDLRGRPLSTRRAALEEWTAENPQEVIDLSMPLQFESWEGLGKLREQGAAEHGHEGVMIKRKDSTYQPGRPKGLWYKWKRDPLYADAILMYAQRGHGKRSSFYSDFTFGVWSGNEIVPIGKAYFGFTDEELKQLDKFVRKNTINRFGPVREVEKTLVLEVAFDSAHESTRHKSGIALRFPRIHRIRWDKPAQEADTLDAMRHFLP